MEQIGCWLGGVQRRIQWRLSIGRETDARKMSTIGRSDKFSAPALVQRGSATPILRLQRRRIQPTPCLPTNTAQFWRGQNQTKNGFISMVTCFAPMVGCA